MQQDLRQTQIYREVEKHFRLALEPAFGRIVGAADIAPSPDSTCIAFTGSRLEGLEETPSTRVCIVNLATRVVEEVTAGPNSDRLPKWSPDGTYLAFLSDRKESGRYQLYLLKDGRIGEAINTPLLEGTVEYLSWSPDGRFVLLGVAGTSADLAGVQGSGKTKEAGEDLPDWIPQIESGAAIDQWRRLWLYDLASATSRPLSRPDLNIWEATWVGPKCIAAVVSDTPEEDAWYTAPLALVDVESGRERVLYRSTRQIGLPTASPSGQCIAVVEALCSDRGVIAGDLLLLDPSDGDPVTVDTNSVDVTSLAWWNETHLLFAGLRGLQSVFGKYDVTTGTITELWSTDEAAGNWFPQARPWGERAFTIVLESYERFPEITIVHNGDLRTVASFSHAGSDYVKQIGGRIETVSWTAPDELEIQGLLVLPDSSGSHQLIVHVHGGPVSATQNHWAMRSLAIPFLVSRGYAVFFPNPRGSSGRGQVFAEKVYGDMGGADAGDILAGIDALVARGVADSSRVGIMGTSYGGFISSWLITRTDRFAAAIAISPVTDWLSQHYTSNIGAFDRGFLQDDPANPSGRYFQRSPLMSAGRVRTPTLLVAGSQDRCTPPNQAIEFYRALREHNVESELVIYPKEGHGVRQLPATIDLCTRIVSWLERFMPKRSESA